VKSGWPGCQGLRRSLPTELAYADSSLRKRHTTQLRSLRRRSSNSRLRRYRGSCDAWLKRSESDAWSGHGHSPTG
jgi:hypothetical protein